MENNPSQTTKPRILETTLRDGSYAIGFQFTASDTGIIARELERAGFDLIEIGHGVGLRASERGHGQALEDDETYLAAAAEALSTAKFGMFCIPGVAELHDLDLAAKYGMGFARIGTNVDDYKAGEPFIAKAKKHGMWVSANLMKSYTMEPKQFAQVAKEVQAFGTDLLCVVDSAGGMLTSELEEYIKAVQDVCDVPIGFHGHNNLGLAVAHSLHAVELGAVVVDSSLQGMGRSAGNAPTEMVVAALERMGYDLGIDPVEVMDIGEKYIRPLMTRRGWGSLDVTSGYALFHSSYMGTVRKYSSKYRVDPRRLIINLCRENKVEAPPELVERLAQELAKEGDEVFSARFDFNRYFGDEQNY